MRRLAAIDVVFLGRKFILVEYVCGVVLSIALGIFLLVRSHSLGQKLFGAYLCCLGINYIPMLAYALSIRTREGARAELGDELAETKKAQAKYRRVSLLLLIPLFVPALVTLRKSAQGRP